jgi:hypothetical protein
VTYLSRNANSRPSPNFGRNNNNRLRASTSHASATSRLLVTAAAVLLAVASGGLGALFAWQVGSKHDAVLGVLSVAMALGLEISKPFAISGAFASLRQWRIGTAVALTLVGVLAVAYSLQAELTFMAMTRGDMVAERAGEVGAGQRAEVRYRKAETELAALKPAGTGKNATTAYLSRRDGLQADLRSAELDRRSAPGIAVADPGAVALSAYASALGLKMDAGQLGQWLPLISVLALEIGAAFSVVLVRSVNGPPMAQVAQPVLAGDPVALETAAPVKARERPAKRKMRRSDYDDGAGPPKRGVAALIDHMKANGGVIDMGQRKLARQLGQSRTTLQRTMRELADAGALVLDTSAAGTRMALA